MGFFKKLFRRKKGSDEAVTATATAVGSATAVRSSSQKKKTKTKQSPAKNKKASSPRTTASSSPVATSSAGAGGVAAATRQTQYEDVRKLESEHSRVLSTLSGSPPSTTSKANNYPAAATAATPSSTAAVVQDENIDNTNFSSNSNSKSSSPRLTLSQQQLKQFDRQHSNSTSPRSPHNPQQLQHQPMYSMSADIHIPPGQMYAMDDMNRSDASSSSFNLSTDAEDSEYEGLRRRGILPGANLSNLDISLTSGPTLYSTDSVGFPSRDMDEDHANRVKTAAMLRPIPAPMPDDDSDEPGRIFPSPKKQTNANGNVNVNPVLVMNNETEDDLRAWNVDRAQSTSVRSARSTPTATSREPTSGKSSVSASQQTHNNNSSSKPHQQQEQQQRFTFEQAPVATARRSEPPGYISPRTNASSTDPPTSSTTSNPASATTATTTTASSGAPRNFTSPRSQSQASTDHSGFSPDPDFNFADFSTFGNNAFVGNNSNNDNTPNDIDNAWREEKKTQDMPSSHHPSKKQYDDPIQLSSPRDSTNYAHSAVSTGQDSSLSELLAQAKNKQRRAAGRAGARSSRASSASVNSAPAITASYLRKHHNLGRYSTGNTATDSNASGGAGGNYGTKYASSDRGGTANEGTSISDIIHSLEATNQTRIRNGGTNHSRVSYGNRSTGDLGAASTARAVKERLRQKRRKEREYNSSLVKSKSSEGSSSDLSDNEASESWLFDEVTGALGPRGIAADLESLSGRSTRSKNSQGNKSHRSHKSKSRRSRHSSSRRQQQQQQQRSSGESVDSRGSRNSRYSHRSTRSFLSQMSEQSRSVANDLLRLEMQLAMVGSSDNKDDIPKRIGGSTSASVGGTSRTSRSSGRKSYSHHRSSTGLASTTTPSSAISHITRRSKATVIAPPGKLGIILANKADSKGTVVSGVRTSSVLAEKINPGDRIVAIDGEDVSRMTVSEITTIMSRKADYERSLTVLTTPKQQQQQHMDLQSHSYGGRRSPSKSAMGTETSFSSHYRG